MSGQASLPFSDLGARLKPEVLKHLFKFYRPGMISMAGGLPMPSCFPVASMDVTMRDGHRLAMVNKALCQDAEGEVHNLYLQYERGDGLADLKAWLEKHMEALHGPLYDEWGCCATVGNTDGNFKILSMLGGYEGKRVICDEHTYSAFLNTARTQGFVTHGVPQDEEGMIPDLLVAKLRECDAAGEPARLLYLIPSASNPTGNCMSQRRKDAIYQIAQEHDLIIIEDDAYFYLRYDPPEPASGAPTSPGSRNAVHDSKEDDDDEYAPGLELGRSFLSRDTDGRVIRLDSLSKTTAPGLRLGWVTGPREFTTRYLMYNEISCQMPNGFSQSIFYGMLREWGATAEGYESGRGTGLEAHLRSVQLTYKANLDALMAACEEMLSPYLAWTRPQAGMFVWFRVTRSMPLRQLFDAMLENEVMLVPGYAFVSELPDGVKSSEELWDDVPFFRATFASGNAKEIREGVRRIAEVFQRFSA